MDDLRNDSAIGRLLEEISWEGNAVRYRDGGRGRENVLTTEVFALLDLLPRTHFLGEVLRSAHEADAKRSAVVAEAEELQLRVLPGDVWALRPDGSRSAWSVQPDVVLESDRCLVWCEVKRIRPSSFQEHQLARTLTALFTTAGQRVPLLLLLLRDPPPVQVQRLGRVTLREALAHSSAHVAEVLEGEVLEDAASAIAWITWPELGQAITDAGRAYTNSDKSTQAAVARMAGSVLRTIEWHS